ncbi:ATP-dependent carboxylate-amine ligase [Halorientalis sp. IM1011]|uniref:RimK family alpha-L-glutamate ligase n=1 Tax=Halorientalis sp. IM1011 TaxID=1932360 RepID=UPI00097CC34F|nr:RimK family alpha-L-glutamate ligase [Halorientalis sp. IM1011]AQL44024.1 ATP-dependent carboxylate-amine ligase [Halorientalis sp. IM1011]
MADTTDPTIGVLSLHTSKETKAICNAVTALGYEAEWLRAENTAVDVRDGRATLEPDADVIVNRLLLSKQEQPAEGLGLAATIANLRPMLNSPGPTLSATYKFATATALAEADVPIPDALLALSTDRLDADRERFGDPAVYKTAIGTHGGGTWKVDAGNTVNAQVGPRQAFLQEFLATTDDHHSDLRVYVVGDEVIAAMSRTAQGEEWRANVALGSETADVTDSLPEDVADIARRATDAVGLDYAGIDVIEGPDGWYVLEVNPTAGFKGLFGATGINPAPYIAKLAIERAGGAVDDEAVAELATELDDSRPACMPEVDSEDPAEPVVIGYTEEVVVRGTRGAETVYAKSDTGATRTSIDAALAADIGTGPIKDIVKIRSGSVKEGRSRPVVDLVVGVGGSQHTVTASIEDRSHMDYPLLLGRDILEHYHVDVTRRADRTTTEVDTEEEEAGEE